MSLQTKSMLYQFVTFAILFIIFRLLVAYFTGLTGYWIPITAFVAATLISPVFKVIRTPNGEKMFVKWIFLKGAKEIG